MIMTESSSMIYKSTRGQAKELLFKDVIFEGLASDGGLYVPSSWPVLDSRLIESFSDMSYQEIAYQVFKPYLDDSISDDTLIDIIQHSYKNFTNEEITPLKKINNDIIDEVSNLVKSNIFYDPAHVKIYEVIESLNNKGMIANPITLKNFFEKDNMLNEVGGT